MSYCFSKTVQVSYDEAVSKVTAELQKEGFGILTQIDVKEKLKEKIGVDFRKYIILGACSPSYAHKALLAEPNIGTMLPCNVVVQEQENGDVQVAAIDPIASMQAVENESLADIATQIQKKLKNIISAL